MKDDLESETALQVAAARAAHRRFETGPLLLDDVHAEALLGEAGPSRIETYGDDAPFILRENRDYLPLRARFTEDRMAEAFERGTRQAILLGAGLDSLAFRQPDAWASCRLYEVDHPNTQRFKAERIARLGWTIPANTRFVACDFEKAKLETALAATDFDPSSPTFVSWLGVVYYLDAPSLEATLESLAGLLAAGSELVLDAMRPADALPERYQAIRSQMTAYLARAGEPQRLRHDPDSLCQALRAAGFGEIETFSVPALFARYRAEPPAVPLSERFFLAAAGR